MILKFLKGKLFFWKVSLNEPAFVRVWTGFSSTLEKKLHIENYPTNFIVNASKPHHDPNLIIFIWK